jgi:hypothetical protein
VRLEDSPTPATGPGPRAESLGHKKRMSSIDLAGKFSFLTGGSIALLCLLALLDRDVWAYRPFVSTDAGVADFQEAEIELGYFNLERSQGQDTFIVPSTVLNYGVVHRLEAVVQFNIETPTNENARLVDSELSLKGVLKEGILQEKEGASVAIEAGLLLPSMVQGERRFGFEGVGILSQRLFPFILHINLGGGVDQANTNPFFIWGVIGELPATPKFRFVGEVNGENHEKEPMDSSGLLGFIWQSPWPNLSLDAGIRRGISKASPDWQFTAGLTIGFFMPSVWTSHTATF